MGYEGDTMISHALEHLDLAEMRTVPLGPDVTAMLWSVRDTGGIVVVRDCGKTVMLAKVCLP